MALSIRLTLTARILMRFGRCLTWLTLSGNRLPSMMGVRVYGSVNTNREGTTYNLTLYRGEGTVASLDFRLKLTGESGSGTLRPNTLLECYTDTSYILMERYRLASLRVCTESGKNGKRKAGAGRKR